MAPHPTPARPRWATPRTADRPSYGPAAGRLARALYGPPMPWQRQVLDVALEVDPATREWAYPTVVLVVQRQAGKTCVVGSAGTHRALTGTDRRCWYTAQRRQDARDNFMDLATVLRRSPLGPLCKVRESQGSEGVSFPTGSFYRIFSPTPDALHGKANAFVCVDEAWSFTEIEGDALVQAIVPTFTTVDGQLWIVSAGGTAESTWLRSYVESGRAVVDAGRRHGLAYFEWGIGDDVDPTDLAAVAAAHPANGYTLRPAALAAAAAAMKPGEFARAYGNRFTGTAERVIAELLWRDAATDPQSPPPQPPRGTMALGFDAGLDDADGAICVAWRDAAGTPYVELVDARPGTSWMAPRLFALGGRWDPAATGHDGIGPALLVADEVTRLGLPPLTPTSAREYTAACAAFLRGLADGTLRIVPSPELDAAAAAAAKRTLGDAWAWGRRQSAATIAPLVAATQALWALDHAPPDPGPFRIL